MTIFYGSLQSYTEKATVEYNQSWDFFDKIYCISVCNRRDRRKTARREFARTGVLERVEFVLVDKHPDNPEQGIYASHLLCMNKGLDAGAKTILLFEDDIVFANFSAATLVSCCAALNRQSRWNALFLGCMVTAINKTSCPALASIRYQCLTHAYAVTADYARHLTACSWQGIPYDGLLKTENHHFFALQPMPAFQSNSPTDNKTLQIDKFRRLLGGLERLQRLNYFYYRNKKTIIISHILLSVLICLALLK
jgi:GR25 family glycosyltransferase involved in LPS biosynthesis